MEKILNKQIAGLNKRNLTTDIFLNKNQSPKPVVIFCHGFKGFKDWGAWHLVAENFAENNFVFLKFNFSYNGIGSENLTEFTNLEAFSKNTYSKELDDLENVLEYVLSDDFCVPETEVDKSRIYLVGHSRGGGIVATKTAESNEVKKAALWASISTFDRFGTPESVVQWKEEGVRNYPNMRTGQDMFISYSFYEDFDKNRSRLDIEKAVSTIEKPLLIAHGTSDEAVGYSHALRLKNCCKQGELLTIENGNHVFGAMHPWKENYLPADLQKVVNKTIEFFNRD